MRCFLLTYPEALISRDKVTPALDAAPEAVANWLSPFPGTILIASEVTATRLREWLQLALPGTMFLIAELSRAHVDGQLPKVYWDFVNDPTANPNPPSKLFPRLEAAITKRGP